MYAKLFSRLFSKIFYIPSLLIAAAACLPLGVAAPGPGQEMDQADWGYDHVNRAKSDDGMPSRPKSSEFSRTTSDTEAVSGAAAKALSGNWEKPLPKSAKKSNPELEAVREVLELASQHKLSPDQNKDVLALISPGESGEAASMWRKMATFWPDVKKLVVSNEQEAEDFGKLLRALLRLVCNSKSISENQAESQHRIVQNILGPERIAVPGSPQLTEEAVNSYTDMACFLYEQKNPGKTVDADDNRAVFAHVIRDKFSEAPSDQAKRAMANFALTWAKFKVAWDLAPADQHEELLRELDTTSGVVTATEPLLKKILANGPWQKLKI